MLEYGICKTVSNREGHNHGVGIWHTTCSITVSNREGWTLPQWSSGLAYCYSITHFVSPWHEVPCLETLLGYGRKLLVNCYRIVIKERVSSTTKYRSVRNSSIRPKKLCVTCNPTLTSFYLKKILP